MGTIHTTQNRIYSRMSKLPGFNYLVVLAGSIRPKTNLSTWISTGKYSHGALNDDPDNYRGDGEWFIICKIVHAIVTDADTDLKKMLFESLREKILSKVSAKRIKLMINVNFLRDNMIGMCYVSFLSDHNTDSWITAMINCSVERIRDSIVKLVSKYDREYVVRYLGEYCGVDGPLEDILKNFLGKGNDEQVQFIFDYFNPAPEISHVDIRSI